LLYVQADLDQILLVLPLEAGMTNVDHNIQLSVEMGFCELFTQGLLIYSRDWN
jgi:hypothetical protein